MITVPDCRASVGQPGYRQHDRLPRGHRHPAADYRGWAEERVWQTSHLAVQRQVSLPRTRSASLEPSTLGIPVRYLAGVDHHLGPAWPIDTNDPDVVGRYAMEDGGGNLGGDINRHGT